MIPGKHAGGRGRRTQRWPGSSPPAGPGRLDRGLRGRRVRLTDKGGHERTRLMAALPAPAGGRSGPGSRCGGGHSENIPRDRSAAVIVSNHSGRMPAGRLITPAVVARGPRDAPAWRTLAAEPGVQDAVSSARLSGKGRCDAANTGPTRAAALTAEQTVLGLAGRASRDSAKGRSEERLQLQGSAGGRASVQLAAMGDRRFTRSCVARSSLAPEGSTRWFGNMASGSRGWWGVPLTIPRSHPFFPLLGTGSGLTRCVEKWLNRVRRSRSAPTDFPDGGRCARFAV